MEEILKEKFDIGERNYRTNIWVVMFIITFILILVTLTLCIFDVYPCNTIMFDAIMGLFKFFLALISVDLAIIKISDLLLISKLFKK